jgi:neutral ceramidase
LIRGGRGGTLAFVAKLAACFRRVDITPRGPASLLGYFNERLSTGVLDPLYGRLAALYGDGECLLFAQVDTCLIGAGDAADLAAALGGACGCPPARVMVLASHTHTAPALADLYEARRDAGYFSSVKTALVEAAAGLAPEQEVSPKICRGSAPGLASNRRWFLRGGALATNPPRGHPSLLRPEGPVDDEVNTIAFVTGRGAVAAMFVSICNHTDTIGGCLVSADWPGVMEARIRDELGTDTLVVPFIGAAGNINHFDFLAAASPAGPEEARRIGGGYAAVVLDSLGRGETAEGLPLGAGQRTLKMPAREITEAEIHRARQIMDAPAPAAKSGDLTAEDIFAGDPGIERMFAGELLRLLDTRPAVYEVPLQVFRAGPVGFFAVPGEPFVETGLALKTLPGPSLAVPVGLANGYLGYIPLRECFARGGYEVKPGSALLHRGAAEDIAAALAEMASALF